MNAKVGIEATEYFCHLWKRSFQCLLIGALALFMSAVSEAQVLPKPDPLFQGKIDINGKVDREISIRSASDNDTLDIGSDVVSPVSPKSPILFEFTGRIESVTIDLL